MKVYTANEDAERIETIRLWGFNVKATEAALWLGAVKWGLGYVDVVAGYDRESENIVMRRYYGLISIKFKEAKNEDRSHNSSEVGA